MERTAWRTVRAVRGARRTRRLRRPRRTRNPPHKYVSNLNKYLDTRLDYAVRDYTDKSSMKLRGQVCNGFRAEATLVCIIRRIAGVTGADARVASFLASELLVMPLPDMFFKLSPIFVLSKPKMVAATADADSIAAQFSTSEIV